MTMLLVNPQEVQPHTYYMNMNYRLASTSAPTVHNILSMAPQHQEHHQQYHHQQQQQAAPGSSSYNNTVAQALEIARESPDGAMDPTVSGILESALAQIWGKVQAHPKSYVMSRDEFAVFNYFQHRFVGDDVATAARKRYWDNAKGV